MLPSTRVPTGVTALYVFAVINLAVLLNLTLVEANVIVRNAHNSTLFQAEDAEAHFGQELPEAGIWGSVVYIDNDGCDPLQIKPPPDLQQVWIAMIARGQCAFDEKVLNAQNKSYNAVIIHNVDSNKIVPMGPGKVASRVNISSVFIGEDDARVIMYYAKKRPTEYQRYTVWLNREQTINYWPLMRDFIVIASCALAFGLLLGLAVLLIRWIRDIRKRTRSRLSLSHLKKIPIKKFKKGDKYDVCAICLDDYEEGEKLRILPCAHTYHQKCIDPWLTKNKKTCPICKRKVIPGNDGSDSEEDSDEENGNRQHSENTPLLGATASSSSSSPPRSHGGTFDNSGVPSAIRDQVDLYNDTSSEDSFTMSTSNYQSSVEIHQPGAQPAYTTITFADEVNSDSDTDSADRNSGALNPTFVEDHFSGTSSECAVLPSSGCINAATDDGSSLDEYKPLEETEDTEVAVAVVVPQEQKLIRGKDRIV